MVIGFLGGSDLVKLVEQLGVDGESREVSRSALCPAHAHTRVAIHDFDYAFAENGLTAFKLGNQLPAQSFIKFLGEDKYKVLVKFILHYLADMDIPIKR